MGTFVAVIGNCQARFIACVLSRLPDATVAAFTNYPQLMEFEGVMAPMYPMNELAPAVAKSKQNGEVIILLEQTSPVAPVGIDIDGLPADHVTRFPNLECYSLWPNIKFSDDRIKTLGMRRLLEIDRVNVRRAEEKADITMLDAWDRRFRTIVPFDSPRHPSAILFADLIVRILERVGTTIEVGKLDEWHQRIAASRGIGSDYLHPVRREFATELGCEWVNRPAYRAWEEAARHSKARRWDDARDALIRTIAAGKAQPDFFRMILSELHVLLAVALEKTDEPSEAHAAAQRAIEARPLANPAAVRAEIAERASRDEDALRHWRECWASDPANLDFAIHVADALVKTGQFGEGIATLERVSLSHPNLDVLKSLLMAQAAATTAMIRSMDDTLSRIKANRLAKVVADARGEIPLLITQIERASSAIMNS